MKIKVCSKEIKVGMVPGCKPITQNDCEVQAKLGWRAMPGPVPTWPVRSTTRWTIPFTKSTFHKHCVSSSFFFSWAAATANWLRARLVNICTGCLLLWFFGKVVLGRIQNKVGTSTYIVISQTNSCWKNLITAIKQQENHKNKSNQNQLHPHGSPKNEEIPRINTPEIPAIGYSSLKGFRWLSCWISGEYHSHRKTAPFIASVVWVSVVRKLNLKVTGQKSRALEPWNTGKTLGEWYVND